MPKVEVLAPFQIKGINEVDYIKNSILEVRENFVKEINEAIEIKNNTFQAICIFSIIDSFAQEYANYPTRGANKTFCDFVLRFQDKYDYLDKIEPITLFYNYEPNIKEVIKYPELYEQFPDDFPPELEICIDDIQYIDEEPVKKILKYGKSEALLDLIEKNEGEKGRNRYAEKHKIINLIYKMRSKLVHELGRLGRENKWEIEEGKAEPFYRAKSRMYEKNEFVVSDDVYELIIPNKFLYDLAVNCINNYLNFCEKENRLPFENNSNFQRSVDITWND